MRIISLFIPMDSHSWKIMSLNTALSPRFPAQEQCPIHFPVTSALHSPAATYVHCCFVLSQLLNILCLPLLPWQHVMLFLTPVLPNGPVYPHPKTVCHSCLPSRACYKGSGWPSAASCHCGQLPAHWHGSAPIIRSVPTRFLNNAGKILHTRIWPTCCSAVFALLVTCLSLVPNAITTSYGKSVLFSMHPVAADTDHSQGRAWLCLSSSGCGGGTLCPSTAPVSQRSPLLAWAKGICCSLCCESKPELGSWSPASKVYNRKLVVNRGN